MPVSCAQACAWAQTESAPNEPPYTNLDNEFEKAEQKPGPNIKLEAGDAGSKADKSQAEAPFVIESPVETQAPNPTPPPPPTEVDAELAHPQQASKKSESFNDIVETQSTNEVVNGYPVVIDPKTQKKYIHHPEAANGLTLIDADGAYYYKPKTSAKNDQTSSVRFGTVTPAPPIQSADGDVTFASMYGNSPSTIIYDYEWKPIQSFGDLGLQAGFGFLTAIGAGHETGLQQRGQQARRGAGVDVDAPRRLGKSILSTPFRSILASFTVSSTRTNSGWRLTRPVVCRITF